MYICKKIFSEYMFNPHGFDSDEPDVYVCIICVRAHTQASQYNELCDWPTRQSQAVSLFSPGCFSIMVLFNGDYVI